MKTMINPLWMLSSLDAFFLIPLMLIFFPVLWLPLLPVLAWLRSLQQHPKLVCLTWKLLSAGLRSRRILVGAQFCSAVTAFGGQDYNAKMYH